MSGDFDDAVAIGGWPMDEHPPGRLRPPRPAAEHRACSRRKSTTSRCARCTAGTSSNLMMAGRNISASYVAFTSARVMATCAVEGQAVGTAAAHVSTIRHAAAPACAATPSGWASCSRRCCATTRRSRAAQPGSGGPGAARARDGIRRARRRRRRVLLDGFTRDIPEKRDAPLGGACARRRLDRAALGPAAAHPRGADHLRHRLQAPADADVAGFR